MEKTPRYTQRERNMVLGYAAQYKEVIENKRTDAESNRKKDEVWRQIAKEFNSRVYHQRTSKQLRQLYKNMKLLLKKDLCGEGKGNRSFMDLLNTLSQQESVAQYIAEQMSPSGGYSSGRQPKFDDDYDDSKLPPNPFGDAMDTGVIVIKSEDMSDNDQGSNNGDMDDDDDDCLSPKDIPEVCLEEEDDEIFMSDLRQTLQSSRNQPNQTNAQNLISNQQNQQQQQNQQMNPQQPEVTIQNVGGIRVGSIGSMANLQLKALQNSLISSNNNNNNNPAVSITETNNNKNNSCSSSSNAENSSNNNSSSSNTRNPIQNQQHQHQKQQQQQQSAAEQAQQQLLLNGLGLSAVVHPNSNSPALSGTATPNLLGALPALQRAVGLSNSSNQINNGLSAAANQLLMTLNGGGGGAHFTHKNSSSLSHSIHSHHHNNHHKDTHSNHHNNNNSSSVNSGGNGTSGGLSSRNNDYLMSLAIEERKRKIDLLNAQIDYWKTLTKMLDANGGHNPTPACLCHFPGKVNGLQTQTSGS